MTSRRCIDCKQISNEEYMHWRTDIYNDNNEFVWRCKSCDEIAEIKAEFEESIAMLHNVNQITLHGIELKKYITVEEEEAYMQEIYDSLIGDIENYMFLTPNWIKKQK